MFTWLKLHDYSKHNEKDASAGMGATRMFITSAFFVKQFIYRRTTSEDM